jgi:DNA-binding Xre family transcriptional regulator
MATAPNIRHPAVELLDRYGAILCAAWAASQGQVTASEADSIVGIGSALIKARIVRNLTQKELAKRLSLAQQQVQRYEATLYRGVAGERLQEVADALRLRVREMITFEPS